MRWTHWPKPPSWVGLIIKKFVKHINYQKGTASLLNQDVYFKGFGVYIALSLNSNSNFPNFLFEESSRNSTPLKAIITSDISYCPDSLVYLQYVILFLLIIHIMYYIYWRDKPKKYKIFLLYILWIYASYNLHYFKIFMDGPAYT